MVLHANRNGKVCYLHCHASCWPSLDEVRASTREGESGGASSGKYDDYCPYRAGDGGAEGILARSVYRRENGAGNAASPET